MGRLSAILREPAFVTSCFAVPQSTPSEKEPTLTGKNLVPKGDQILSF